jgi:hypothetical protein
MARTSQNHAGGNGSRCNAMSDASRASSARPMRASHQARARTQSGHRSDSGPPHGRSAGPPDPVFQDATGRSPSSYGTRVRWRRATVPAGRNSWPAPCCSPAGLANIYRVGCALEKRMPARNHGRVAGNQPERIVSSNLTSASTNPADRTSLLPGFLFITGAATHLSPQNRIAKWLHYRIRPQSRDAGSGLI